MFPCGHMVGFQHVVECRNLRNILRRPIFACIHWQIRLPVVGRMAYALRAFVLGPRWEANMIHTFLKRYGYFWAAIALLVVFAMTSYS